METRLFLEDAETLYESDSTLVLRAFSQEQKPLIVKRLKPEAVTPENIQLYQKEFDLLRELEDINGVISAIALENCENTPCLILEDIGGNPLNGLVGTNGVDLDQLLDLSIRITQVIGEIHLQQILHKDICPSNVLFNQQTNELKVIDFGIADRFDNHRSDPAMPEMVQGTLHYISPEQTGRIDRNTDYRADFYSLGATIYYLAAGHPPFSAHDPIEQVHAHLAKHPEPLHTLSSTIPPVLSEMVSKLMAKVPEERYQSCRSILSDLQQCRNLYQTSGSITDFVIDKGDQTGKIGFSNVVYGREKQKQELLNTFRLVRQGIPKVTMVSGLAGIGKTVLIREMEQSVTHAGGFFVTGKFEQFQHDIQFGALITAFRGAVRQVLTSQEDRFESLKAELIKVLSENGRLLIELIPELEMVTGINDSVPNLEAIETTNRFQQFFLSFVELFAKPEHPLALFMDDLHWADRASLDLMRLLLSAKEISAIWLIGAFRSNELRSSHPVNEMIEELENTSTGLQAISLAPLDVSVIHKLIFETFHIPDKKNRVLAEIVHNKTEGNPLIIKEFLSSIVTKSLLSYDYVERQWGYDPVVLAGLETAENVVHLIVNRMKLLDTNIGDLLQLAACLGNRFEAGMLSVISDIPFKQIILLLGDAVREGFIVPLQYLHEQVARFEVSVDEDSSEQLFYKFAHDRIQQAAYSFVRYDERPAIHYRIGRQLFNFYGSDGIEGEAQIIANQFNLGISCIATDKERYDLVGLNRIAGLKAKAALAFEPARIYFKSAIGLLHEIGSDESKENDSARGWKTDYELCLTLYGEYAETTFMVSEYEELYDLLEVVIPKTREPFDEVRFVNLQIRALNGEKRLLEAIDVAVDLSRRLGISLPSRPQKAHVALAFLKTRWDLRSWEISELAQLPPKRDKGILSALDILSIAVGPAFAGWPNLIPLIVFVGIRYSLQHGHCRNSIFGYAGYSMIIYQLTGDLEKASEYADLSLQLLEKFNAREIEARTIATVYGFVKHWAVDNRQLSELFRLTFHRAMKIGDYVYGSMCARFHVNYLFFTGAKLEEVLEHSTRMFEKLKQLRQDVEYSYTILVAQVCHNLQGENENPVYIQGSLADIELLEQDPQLATNVVFIFRKGMINLIMAYLFGDIDRALEQSEISERQLSSVRTIPDTAQRNFYDSLARLLKAEHSKGKERKKLLKQATKNQKEMKKWAENGPMNHLMKFELVEAERYRVLGQYEEAVDFYKRATLTAKNHGYIQIEALANELRIRLHLAENDTQSAALYLRRSIVCYRKWGAVAKVEDLEKRYEELTSKFGGEHLVAGKSDRIVYNGFRPDATTLSLDWFSVLKASQTLSKEIQMENLLKEMVQIVVENCGAEYGCLILSKGQRLEVVCEISSDGKDEPELIAVPVEQSSRLPLSIIHFVSKYCEPVLCKDARSDQRYRNDPYIQASRSKSILALPIEIQAKLFGVMYMENNLASGIFTEQQLELLRMLSTQMAISLENARLFIENKQRAHERIKQEKRVAREKEHIIRELHDGIGGSLVHIRTLAEMVKGNAEIPAILDKLNMISELSEESLAELRGLFHSMDVAGSNYQSVFEDIEQYGGRLLQAHEIEFKTEVVVSNEPDTAPDSLLTLILFNVCREGLNNVVKHAQATRVTLSIHLNSELLSMTLSDNGRGLLEEEPTRGRGIKIMRKRAEEVGGKARIYSNNGTTVELDIPIQQKTFSG